MPTIAITAARPHAACSLGVQLATWAAARSTVPAVTLVEVALEHSGELGKYFDTYRPSVVQLADAQGVPAASVLHHPDSYPKLSVLLSPPMPLSSDDLAPVTDAYRRALDELRAGDGLLIVTFAAPSDVAAVAPPVDTLIRLGPSLGSGPQPSAERRVLLVTADDIVRTDDRSAVTEVVTLPTVANRRWSGTPPLSPPPGYDRTFEQLVGPGSASPTVPRRR